MSHLKIIEEAKKNNLDHVLIVEDDITFLNPDLFKEQFNLFLKNHKDFDVVLIAGNNMPPFQPIDESCVKVTRCQTTTGYLVKNHYYDTLIHNYRNGITKLMKEPQNHVLYAIDKFWFHLQEKHNWYLITPLTVTQRNDYSDIEKRQTNYSKALLDLDKVNFFKEQQEKYDKFKNVKQFMKLF
jgi:GR25 family glycosyltransferase involved in LPS biosynthesis